MLFHEKTKVPEQYLYTQYQVLCGIEEEFLIINKNGRLAKVADDISKKISKRAQC